MNLSYAVSAYNARDPYNARGPFRSIRGSSNIPINCYTSQMARPTHQTGIFGYLYHLISCGDRWEDILLRDNNRSDWLAGWALFARDLAR